jgi:hypothetical protein
MPSLSQALDGGTDGQRNRLHGLCRRALSGFQQTLKCRDNRGQTQVTLRLRPMAKILMSTIPAMKPPMCAA